MVEGGAKETKLKLPRSQHPRIRGLLRDAEGLEG
jgi:hypothetical protein